MPPLAATAAVNNTTITGSGVVVAPPIHRLDDELVVESEELDGYFSDTPLEPKPIYPILNETHFPNAIIVLNLPQVNESKLEKLTKVVMKLVTRLGTLQTVIDETTNEILFNGMYMPYDKTIDSTVGFCFIEYTTIEFAEQAIKALNDQGGYKFDKNHSLIAMFYEHAKKLQSLDSTTFVPPTVPTFTEITSTKPNPIVWLEDSNQRDQFIIRHSKAETEVYWFDSTNQSIELDYNGIREKEAGVCWCDYYCFWSTNGNYLATLVPSKGVIVWSGSTYEKIGRYPAPGVKVVVFSPQENYLLTNNEDPRDPTAIKVYHVTTGKLLRTFGLYPDNVPTNIPPPPFLFSYNDEYIGRMGKDLISIFVTSTMKLLNQRSLTTDGINEFQWCPKSNIIAYWAPEQNNSPAHVDLIEIPSRMKLRQKNLFNVTRCHMVWQDLGQYLAVKVTRHTKSKKTLYNNIELFRLNEIGIPVEMLDTKDAVMALQFEPKGTKFAMIHAENPASAKVKVSFYDMMKVEEQQIVPSTSTKPSTSTTPTNTTTDSSTTSNRIMKKVSELHLIETLDGRQCNFISWSPAGNVIVMASLGDNASGTIEFYDVVHKTMVVKEHYRCNQIVWDPSGRTVASIVSQPIEGGNFKFAMDNGYIIWNFQGKQLYQSNYESFYQFLWRPRLSLLSITEIEQIKRNIKHYEKQFSKADRIRQRQMYLEETTGKRLERNKFRTIVQDNLNKRLQYRQHYIDILNGYDSEDDNNYRIVESISETVLSRKEEVVHA